MRDFSRVKIIIMLVLIIIGTTLVAGCSRRITSGPSAPTETVTMATPALRSTSSPAPSVGAEEISAVKVVIIYERVSDGVAIGRSTNDVVSIFRDTNTDLILRGFFRWEPVPESADATLPGYSKDYVSGKANVGYTYRQLGDAIRQIKAEKPDTLFIGAIAAQRLNKNEVNDMTGEAFSPSKTWAMALDPAKFGAEGSKNLAQCQAIKGLGWIGSSTTCTANFDPASSPAYFPDITNRQYQDLLVSWAEKQIDLGADGIWIDMLYAQANYFETAAPKSTAIGTSYDASSQVIDRIHEYGKTKYGKRIYVGTWWTFAGISYSPARRPDVDFVTVAIPAEEITRGLDRGKWDDIKKDVADNAGNVPIIAYIDWNGNANGPMGVFSQSLTKEQQKAWLNGADDFFSKEGIIFAYPVHGGTFPMSSKVLTFGKYNVYDSIAPQFETYETIRTLALKKSAG